MEQQIEQQKEQRISNANHAINNMFVNNDECEISTLGGSYLNNFLLTGTLKKGFCVLTDKRVYFRGNCYSRFGNEYRTNREERIVGLKDITGTGFVDIRYWWLKLIFIMSAILSLSFFILNESMPYNQHTTQTTAEFCTFFCCITIILKYPTLAETSRSNPLTIPYLRHRISKRLCTAQRTDLML